MPFITRFPISVDDRKMYLDANDDLGLFVWRVYEVQTKKFMEQQIKTGDNVLDIGANIGYFTLLMAKLAGHQGRVFAFEPEVNNFKLLKRNVDLNNCDNIVLIPKAVSNESNRGKLYLFEKHIGGHIIWDPGKKKKFIEIDLITLDDYFKEFQEPIRFIKMDVQGAEFRVLKGMHGLIQRNKNLSIATEYWPHGIKACGDDPAQYLESLHNYGFEIYRTPPSTYRLQRLSASEFKIMAQREDETNLFCIRQ